MLRALVLVLAGLALTTVTQEPRGGITVSAASSLTDVMESVAQAYAAAGGGPVRFNFAGSNVLARQIASGAPVDVFISADQAQMDVAQQAGGIDGSTRIDLLGNRLAIVTRRGMTLHRPGDLGQPSIGRIAIANPEAVPSGVYARKYFVHAGLWERLLPKIVPVGNVRAALASVENGSADAAVVYVTDAALSRGAVLALVLDGPGAPRIVYPAAITRASRNRAAAAHFLEFLKGPQAAAIFKRFGFTPARAATG